MSMPKKSVRRSGTESLKPPLRIGRWYRYCCAASANAKVTTARYSPRTRSAPAPMSAASPAVMSDARSMAGPNLQRLDRRRDHTCVSCQPRSMLTPRMKAAVRSAPTPANAICPRDNWPAQPVSTVSDRAQMANARIDVYSRCREGCVTIRGRTTPMMPRSTKPIRSIWRNHQIWRNRSGTGWALAPKAKVWVSPRPCRLCQ